MRPVVKEIWYSWKKSCKLVFLISYVPVGNNVLCGLFEAHIQPLQSLRILIKKPHENDSSYHLNSWQCLCVAEMFAMNLINSPF